MIWAEQFRVKLISPAVLVLEPDGMRVISLMFTAMKLKNVNVNNLHAIQ